MSWNTFLFWNFSNPMNFFLQNGQLWQLWQAPWYTQGGFRLWVPDNFLMLIMCGIQIQPNLLMGMCQKMKVAQNIPKHILILELMKSDEILEICKAAACSILDSSPINACVCASTWIKTAQRLCWLSRGQQVLQWRWIWGIHCAEVTKHTSKGSTLALIPNLGTTRIPKQGYQWSYKNNWLPPKFFEKKRKKFGKSEKFCAYLQANKWIDTKMKWEDKSLSSLQTVRLKWDYVLRRSGLLGTLKSRLASQKTIFSALVNSGSTI